MSSSIFGGAQDTTDARSATSGHSNKVDGLFSTAASDNAVSVGALAKLAVANLAAGSTQLTDNKGQLGGVTISGKGATLQTSDNSVHNVTTSDPATTQLAIAANATLADNFAKSLSDLVGKNTDSQAKTYEAIAGLAESKQNAGAALAGQQLSAAVDAQASADTSGVSRFSKPVLIALGLIAAVVALYFWKRK